MTRALFTHHTGPDFDSSVLESVAYNEIDQILYVNLHSGDQYCYYNVGSARYSQLISARSPGSYWNNYIKGNTYRGSKGTFDLVDYYGQGSGTSPLPASKAAPRADGKKEFLISFTLSGEITVAGDDLLTVVNTWQRGLPAYLKDSVDIKNVRILSAGEK